jgi:predicted permease
MVPVVIDKLGPVLIETFGVILLGYLVGRSGVMSPDTKQLGAFLGKIALPALLFEGMSKLNWKVVQWAFLGGVFLGKTTLFILVVVVTWRLYGGDKHALARGGLYGLFATQSNDFALGLPVINGVFDVSHPSFVTFFYLTGPTQVAWINPMAFALLESGQSNKKSAGDGNKRGAASLSCWKVTKGVLMNPIVFCTLAGLIANLIFTGPIPSAIINRILTILGNAYDAIALFSLGLSMAVRNLPQYTSADFKVR